MKLLESVRIALGALRANVGRSLLTMLGVIIGVAAVILLVAIGSGVETAISGQIQGIGTNLLFVLPGKVGQGGGFGSATGVKQFTLDDAQLLETQLTGALVVPIVQAPVTVQFQDRSMSSVTYAGTGNAPQVFTSVLAGGSAYTQAEVDGAERVADIGATVETQLFQGQDPIGQTITVNGQPFRILGYYHAQGGTFAGDQDNRVYMPITTAQQLFGISNISFMVVKVSNTSAIPQTKSQIETLLKPKYSDNFTVLSQQQTLGVLSTVLGTLTIMLAGIAGISLLVGGIGIMNIMLVSVSERTREIGIRKAVGATTLAIMTQFVIEAVLLSVFGGVLGIIVGAVGAIVLQAVVPTQVTWWSVVIAFGFSVAVGVFFGAYPAWRASRLEPIEALRYE